VLRWGCLPQPIGQKARVLDPALPHLTLLSAATATAPVSPFPLCRPEEDPFLLLESAFHAVQDILARFQVRVGASWFSQATAQVGVRPP
jgi:hypothetical protein